jgi:hypothetical protein
VARRSTLELLRVLRRRERENQGRALAVAVRDGDVALAGAKVTRARRARVASERDDVVAAERARLDAGTATAGAVAGSHLYRRTVEERLATLAVEEKRAAEEATRALAREAHTRSALERASHAATRIDEHVAGRDADLKRRDETRDEEAFADARNAEPLERRSRETP